jgi:predicted Mrr-cat superfamily restriction endonuclease
VISKTYLLQRDKKNGLKTPLYIRKVQRKECGMKQRHLRSTEVSHINVEEVEQQITSKSRSLRECIRTDTENGSGLKRGFLPGDKNHTW